MSQFIFSGAANHINFEEPEEYQYSIGFGNAVRFMAREFKKSGLKFSQGTERINNVPNLAFCYPNEFDFLKSQYSIAYMPWESTGMDKDWVESLNQCDDVWTTSPWSQKNLEALLNREVFVYQHGVPEFCAPFKRKRKKDVIRFLHIGEPAIRKGGQDVVNSFAKLFGNNPNYQLILKCSGVNATRIYNENMESLGTPPSHYSNILVIEDYFNEKMLLELYKKCDIFIYPSYGEGFGFNSAYSIATSMPTICTSEWATYSEFITAPLNSEYVDSPWPSYHPGKMVQPDLNQMEKFMIDISENYDKYANEAFKNSIGIHEKFNWERVSEKPIKRLKKIISLTSKS